jgi:hypothetical protein
VGAGGIYNLRKVTNYVMDMFIHSITRKDLIIAHDCFGDKNVRVKTIRVVSINGLFSICFEVCIDRSATHIAHVGFEVLTAVVMKSTVFWDIMPCS